jgi:hypothetical protein
MYLIKINEVGVVDGDVVGGGVADGSQLFDELLLHVGVVNLAAL